MRRFLKPIVRLFRWSGDGEHGRRGEPTWTEGWSLSIAWLGLHIEFIVATEKRS